MDALHRTMPRHRCRVAPEALAVARCPFCGSRGPASGAPVCPHDGTPLVVVLVPLESTRWPGRGFVWRSRRPSHPARTLVA